MKILCRFLVLGVAFVWLLPFNVLATDYKGPGLVKAPLMTQTSAVIGMADVWNTRDEFRVKLRPADGWTLQDVKIYIGNEAVPATKKGNLVPGLFNYKDEDPVPDASGDYWLKINLVDSLGITWGVSTADMRLQNVAVYVSALKTGAVEEETAWAYTGLGVATRTGEIDETTLTDFEGVGAGWWFTYSVGHPRNGHVHGPPIGGLNVTSPTYSGITPENGAFDFFPGETATFAIGHYLLGSTPADHKVTVLDFFPLSDTDDPRVINMARLLQSLDSDAEPQGGVMITDDVVTALDEAMTLLTLDSFDFSDDDQTTSIIQTTLAVAPDLGLVEVTADDAIALIDKSLDSSMFRKNVSKTPDQTSSKSKLNIMGMWFPALRANGDPAVIEYYDDSGALIRTTEDAKPVVVTYTDGVDPYGYEDIFAGISRDDGNTFKRMNLSRAADRTSFTLATGEAYYGEAKKPVFQVKGNKILVAWTSKFCNGGKPAYAIDPEDDYTFDDPYYTEDIWGVGGPQRSVDYAELGFPEVGEVPYSCVWTARGTMVTQGMINSSPFWAKYALGDIVWFKPERLTSGRRDANQVFMGGADGAGFAIAWQEDPEGLRPGSAAGPGPGWGGATTNHKTDIWYSYVTWDDFLKVDGNFVAGGDPDHELNVLERPKSLVPMSLPVRVTDNDTVNSVNIMATKNEDGTWTPIPNPDTSGDGDGTHAYGYAIPGVCVDFEDWINASGETKQVCVTEDNRLLIGNTGASRPNLFLQTYTKSDGTKSAWAIFAYEETKGVGTMLTVDMDPADIGKNAIYHSFDFQTPDLVSAGNIINLPERDLDGNLIYLVDESGVKFLDWLGNPILAYENARRPRFILQSKAAAFGGVKSDGSFVEPDNTGTVLLVLYKEGPEGRGRASDIMLRRVVANTPGNPYAFNNFVCNTWETAENGDEVCVDGVQNMSSVTPTVTTDSMGDPNVDDPYGAVKVVEWSQTVDNLADLSSTNPYDDARAHRGQIRGDFVTMGFSYTPNWAAARNGNDKYDFYSRRSFDGGQTWTTDPTGGGVTHCDTFTDPITKEKTEVCNTYATGEFEQMRNLSQLPNNNESVIEPRIVACPGTIKVDGVWTGIAEDKQNKNVFYVSYGTSTNPKKDPVTGEQDAPYPLDLYYSFSQDRGENYVEVAWDVNPDSDGNFSGETVYRWDFLAKGDPEQGEAQLRMTPDGSRFYSTWLEESEEGSDIMFRRIMSPAFPVNVAQ